jgi:murein DD-endopeptidase MepM/ murein hydrolase activator NlpD
MQKLTLPFEVKPFVINQEYGVYRPDIYKQFGFTCHNGIDVRLGNRKEVRAPFDFVVTQVLWQPNGGGHVVGIMSLDEFKHPDGDRANVQIDFMHLERVLLKAGDRGVVGDLVAIADNTGFSTGPHTHIRYKWQRRRGSRWVDVDKNDAQNSFDPKPYRTGDFAEDFAVLSLLQQVLALLLKLRGTPK